MKPQNITIFKYLLFFLIFLLVTIICLSLNYEIYNNIKLVLGIFIILISTGIVVIISSFHKLFATILEEKKQLNITIEKLLKSVEVQKDTNNQLQRINTELTVSRFENTSILEEYNKTMAELSLLNEKLAASNELMELQKQDLFDLYHNAPCGYFTVNAQDVLTSVNRTALKWIGYQQEDVLNTHLFEDYLTENSKILYRNAFQIASQKGGFSGLLLHAVSKNGEEMPFILNAFTLFDENKNIKLLRCTCYDMRDRLKYEKKILDQKKKAEEANEAKNIFLSKMSHELRTPLHGIIGNLSLLKKNQSIENQKDILTDLDAASEKMSVIINDIFDMVSAINTSKNEDLKNDYITKLTEIEKKLDFNAKILIVDDENLNQKLLIGMLRQLNLKADIADNGKIAVEMFQKNQYDLILMDISMPEMNGIEASKNIMNFGNKKPIIIAITANIIRHEMQEYLDAGIIQCLTKPTRFNDFLEAIQPYFNVELKPLQENNALKNANSDDILDYVILNQILETAQSIGNDFDKMMLSVAQKEIPVYASKVKEFLDLNNQKELIEMLHKLKGASWTSGMKKVGDLCRDYEIKAKQNDFSIDVSQLIILINISLEMLEEFYSAKHTF